MLKIDIAAVPARKGTGYPAPFGSGSQSPASPRWQLRQAAGYCGYLNSWGSHSRVGLVRPRSSY